MGSLTLIICAITLLSMILILLIKPIIKIKSFSISLYWIVALGGALLLIVTGCISPGAVASGLLANHAINPVKLLVIFFSMTVMSIFLDEIGFFAYVANVVLAKAKTSQKKLFTCLYLIVSALTVFTSNDIVILTFTPIILYFTKNAKINPFPYLICEFVAANTLSMLLIVGNPTNIYLATSFDIDFFTYLKIMFIPALFSFACVYFILLLLFKKPLSLPINATENIQIGAAIKDKFLLVTGLAHLSLCIITLAVASYIDIEMWIISLAFAVSELIFILIYLLIKKPLFNVLTNSIKRLPYELIPFVISMFVMVFALSARGFTSKISGLLDSGNSTVIFGLLSFVGANLINNLPMSVLFSGILAGINPSALTGSLFATIISSNIGAYLTPLGALAGIMWMQILKHNGIEFSFKKFVKYGVIIAIPSLISALAGLYVSLLIFA